MTDYLEKFFRSLGVPYERQPVAPKRENIVARLTIPVIWTFGADDRNVPTALCIEALQALRTGHDFSWVVLPTTHTPLVLPNGLLASLPGSPGFQRDFFPAIGRWLRSRSIAR